MARLLGASLLFGCGCEGGGGDGENVASAFDCADEDRAEPFTIGLTKAGEIVDVSFVVATPAPPGKTDNSWRVLVVDKMGTPVEGVEIVVMPMMPDHGHGTTKDPVVTAVAGVLGQYDMSPVALHMSGYWEVTFELSLPDMTSDAVTFKLCIDR
ncbi:MAG: FixH family protein [Nannocystaceae bacterium]